MKKTGHVYGHGHVYGSEEKLSTGPSSLEDNIVVRTEEFGDAPDTYIVLGKRTRSETIRKIFAFQQEQGTPYGVQLLSEEIIANSPWLTEFSVVRDRDYDSYVYHVRAALDDFRRLGNQRRRLISFRNRFPTAKLELYEFSNKRAFAEVLDLFRSWQTHKGKTDSETERERLVLQLMHEANEHFKLQALLLCVDGRYIGFQAFELKTPPYAMVHFSKIAARYVGAEETIHRKVAEIALQKGYQYLNVGEDLGQLGLRHHKQSYCPEFMVKAYSLYPKDASD